MQRALRDNNTSQFESMRIVREIAASTIAKIAGNACAAGIFVIHAGNELQLRTIIATHRYVLKAHRADSESLFLAIKKFSWLAR